MTADDLGAEPGAAEVCNSVAKKTSERLREEILRDRVGAYHCSGKDSVGHHKGVYAVVVDWSAWTYDVLEFTETVHGVCGNKRTTERLGTLPRGLSAKLSAAQRTSSPARRPQTRYSDGWPAWSRSRFPP